MFRCEGDDDFDVAGYAKSGNSSYDIRCQLAKETTENIIQGAASRGQIDRTAI